MQCVRRILDFEESVFDVIVLGCNRQILPLSNSCPKPERMSYISNKKYNKTKSPN